MKRLAVACLVAGALLFVAAGLVARRQLLGPSGWTRVQAKVLAATVTLPGPMDGGPEQDQYGIRLDASFTQGGRTVRRSIEPAWFDGPYYRVAAHADAMRDEGIATLLVDPKNPDRAQLEPTLGYFSLGLPIVLAIFGVVALGFAWGAARFEGSYLDRNPIVVFLGVGALCWGGALAVCGVAVERACRWPAVSAKVVQVDTVMRGSSSHSVGSGNAEAPRAWLEFPVGGRRYRTVYVGIYSRSNGTAYSAYEDIDRWQRRGWMTVRYDPDNPYHVQHGAVSWFVLGMLALFGTLFGGVGALPWLFRRRTSRKHRATSSRSRR